MSRLLPRFTDDHIQHDPLEIALAAQQARHEAAVEAANQGRTPDANPQDLRGIPVVGRGVPGASPGTAPHNIRHPG